MAWSVNYRPLGAVHSLVVPGTAALSMGIGAGPKQITIASAVNLALTGIAPIVTNSGSGVVFDKFISPNGDDNNTGTLASPWSITALNSKQTTYTGLNIGIIGDIAGVQTPIQFGTIGGVQTNLYDMYQAQPGDQSDTVLHINGGSSSKSTYIASCNSSGVYVPPVLGTGPWAVIDFSQPGSGGTVVPTVPAFAIGQNFFRGSVPNQGYVTVDGLGIRYFTQGGLTLSDVVAGTMPGILIKNCEIYNGNNIIPDENPAAIYLSGCIAPIINNNKVHDLQTVTGGGGSTVPWGHHALSHFTCTNVTLTNNTFYNCAAVLPKDTHQDYLNCSYNYFDHGVFGSSNDSGNIGQGAIESLSTGTGVTSFIHHNIILGALNLRSQDGNNMQGTVQCYNNTFYGTSAHPTPFSAIQADMAVSGASLQFQHNIVYSETTYDHGGGYGECLWITANIAVTNATFNNNVYGSNSNAVSLSRGGFTGNSLATWHGLTGCDTNSVLVSSRPFLTTPSALSMSSFTPSSAATIGGVICGAVDGSGPIGCNF